MFISLYGGLGVLCVVFFPAAQTYHKEASGHMRFNELDPSMAVVSCIDQIVKISLSTSTCRRCVHMMMCMCLWAWY